ncbi:MAG: hypothetical protein ACOC3G_00790 [Phycisphaeraceae bacterium]
MENSTGQDHMRVLKHIRICAIVTAVSSALIACLLLWPIVGAVAKHVLWLVKDWLDLFIILLFFMTIIGLSILISVLRGQQQRTATKEAQ